MHGIQVEWNVTEINWSYHISHHISIFHIFFPETAGVTGRGLPAACCCEEAQLPVMIPKCLQDLLAVLPSRSHWGKRAATWMMLMMLFCLLVSICFNDVYSSLMIPIIIHVHVYWFQRVFNYMWFSPFGWWSLSWIGFHSCQRGEASHPRRMETRRSWGLFPVGSIPEFTCWAVPAPVIRPMPMCFVLFYVPTSDPTVHFLSRCFVRSRFVIHFWAGPWRVPNPTSITCWLSCKRCRSRQCQCLWQGNAWWSTHLGQIWHGWILGWECEVGCQWAQTFVITFVSIMTC